MGNSTIKFSLVFCWARLLASSESRYISIPCNGWACWYSCYIGTITCCMYVIPVCYATYFGFPKMDSKQRRLLHMNLCTYVHLILRYIGTYIFISGHMSVLTADDQELSLMYKISAPTGT